MRMIAVRVRGRSGVTRRPLAGSTLSSCHPAMSCSIIDQELTTSASSTALPHAIEAASTFPRVTARRAMIASTSGLSAGSEWISWSTRDSRLRSSPVTRYAEYSSSPSNGSVCTRCSSSSRSGIARLDAFSFKMVTRFARALASRVR